MGIKNIFERMISTGAAPSSRKVLASFKNTPAISLQFTAYLQPYILNTIIMDALQEFEEPDFKYQLTGILKKNIAGVLDAIIVLLIADLLGNFVIPYNFFVTDFSAGKMGFYYLSVFILYRIVAVVFLSSTVGMRLLRCQYMQEGNFKLTLKEKVLAALMVYVNGIRMYNLK